MADVAELGLKISSEGVTTATKELDKLEKQSEQTERATERLHDETEKSSSAMGRMAKAAAAAAAVYASFRIAAGTLQTFVQATSHAEHQQAQLAAGLRSTAGVSGQTIESLNAHAAALQKVTNVGDEAINSAQGVLLTFSKISGETFPRATAAALDLSERMGMDLNSSVLQVGKALNDPVLGMTALSRAGIQFTEAQKDTVKSLVESNDMLGAQSIILNELELQFGGSAKAARETLGGALKSLENAWGDLFEISGTATEGLRKAIESLITAIQNPAFVSFMQMVGTALVGAMTLAVGGAQLLADGISLLMSNLDTVAVMASSAGVAMAIAFGPAILGAMVTGLVAVGTAGVAAISAIGVAIAANPLGALLIGITTLVSAVYIFRDEIKDVLGVDAVSIAKDAANMLIGLFGGAYRAIVVGWGLLPGAFADIFTRAMNGAIDIVQNGVNAIVGALKNIPGLGDIQDVDLSQFKGQETGGAGKLGTAVSGAFSDAMGRDYIGELTQGLSEMTGNSTAANEALANMQTILEGEGGALGDSGGVNGALEAANDNIYQMSDALAALGPATVDPLTMLGQQISDLDGLLAQGKISWQEYGEAAFRANMAATSSTLGLASGLTGALSSMFKDNKAFAIANAVVNTAEAITKALATYGPTPWGFAAAGVAAATGAAQIAAIASSNKGSSSAPSVGGGAVSAGQAGQQDTGRTTNVTLVGNGFTGEQIAELLNEFTDDGGTLNVTTAA